MSEKINNWRLWLYDLFFADKNTGWVMGTTSEYGGDAILVKTTDGGKTWSEIKFRGIGYSEIKKPHYPKIFFIDNKRGVIITTRGYMHITIDGGNNWNKERLPVRRHPWHVSEIFRR